MRASSSTARASLSTASALLVATFAACSDTPPPPGQLDGNFIVGDGPSTVDALAADALVPSDRDSGPDAGAEDAAPLDTGAADARPDATTTPFDGGIVESCVGSTTISLGAAEVVARASSLAGRLVDVVGTATVGPPSCTPSICPPESPCCNACSAELSLDAILPLRTSTCTPQVACQGDECNLVCSPPVLGFPQTFRGVVRDAPTPGLELMRVLP